MKTSNKILIAFASALILLPILVMAVISSVYYTEGKEPENNRIYGTQAFDVTTKGMTATRLSGSFETVTIDGGKQQLHMVIKLIKDKHLGVKIPNEFKDIIVAGIDAAGQLQIRVNELKENHDSYANIWVYAPNITKLAVANAKGINLNANIDSLNLVISNIESAYIDGEVNIGKLVLHAENVNGFGIEEGNGDVQSAFLELRNSNFRSNMNSFESLSVSTSGSSNVEIFGGEDENSRRVIKNLNINTKGKSEVKIYNILVEHCGGSFSDSTRVEMPAVNLNQMYSPKK